MLAVLARRLAALLAVLIVATAIPVAAQAADADKDGLTNAFETKWRLSSPTKQDSDGAGVIDAAEDFDNDGLGALGEQRAGTNPRKADTDGDGVVDSLEDHDGDGRSNALEQDQRRVPLALKPTLARAARDRPRTKGKWCSPPPASSRVKTCHFGNPKSDTTVVLMGDSHAVAWSEAAWRAAESSGWHLITLFKSACVPLTGVYSVAMHKRNRGKACEGWREGALEWIAKRGRKIDVLILATSDAYTLARPNGSVIKAAAGAPIWAAGMRKTLKAVPERIKVIVLGDVPRNTRDPVTCLKHNRGDMSRCVTPRESGASLVVADALRRATRSQGEYHRSLNGQICPYDPCPLVQGTTMVWRDKSHLTGTFARKLMPSFRRMVNDVLKGK